MKSKLTKLREDCDRLMQQLGTKKYKWCEVCGAPRQVLHHFYPKSQSSRLRYDSDNLINLCNGCHMRHHQAGDPTIHATIIKNRGVDWYDQLSKTRFEMIKVNIAYYSAVKELLLRQTNELATE